MPPAKKGLVWQEEKEHVPVGMVKMRDGSFVSEKVWEELLRNSLMPFGAFPPEKKAKKSRIMKWRSRFADVAKTTLVGLAVIAVVAIPIVLVIALLTAEVVMQVLLYFMTGALIGFCVFLVGAVIREIHRGGL